MGISVVVLTFNSENVIADTLAAAKRVSGDLHVADSLSSDRTVEIARAAGATVVQRPFVNYSEQRNWTMTNLPLRHPWQLHLDADEILSDALVADLKNLDGRWPDDVDGFFIPRLTRFLGRDLRHGGLFPTYHMRLFRSGCAQAEDRKYDQHFVLNGRGCVLPGHLIDDHRMTIGEWTQRHNRWAELEAEDVLQPSGGVTIRADAKGNPIERARARKLSYYRKPMFLRAFMLFVYRYFLRGGFRDGVPGLIYCFLQSCWYRFLVDAKIYERRLK
jgi:glycosyltransferase involved in cell wall biosynthesis